MQHRHVGHLLSTHVPYIAGSSLAPLWCHVGSSLAHIVQHTHTEYVCGSGVHMNTVVVGLPVVWMWHPGWDRSVELSSRAGGNTV